LNAYALLSGVTGDAAVDSGPGLEAIIVSFISSFINYGELTQNRKNNFVHNINSPYYTGRAIKKKTQKKPLLGEQMAKKFEQIAPHRAKSFIFTLDTIIHDFNGVIERTLGINLYPIGKEERISIETVGDARGLSWNNLVQRLRSETDCQKSFEEFNSLLLHKVKRGIEKEAMSVMSGFSSIIQLALYNV
jgi:hypothetical protein